MKLVHITYLKMSKWNWDSSSSKLNDILMTVSVPDIGSIFLSTTFEAHIDFDTMDIRDSFSKGKAVR